MRHTGDTDEMIVNIVEAVDLPNADAGKTASARSDPFVIIYWNDVVIGRTAVIEDNLFPVWLPSHGYAPESFRIPLPPTAEQTRLKVEVRDYDSEGCVGDFLGQVVLDGNGIYDVLRVAGGQATKYNLERNKLSQEEQLVQGSLTMSLRVVDTTRCLMASYATYSHRFQTYR